MRNLTNLTDEQLALAYAEGDNKAFDLLLKRNADKLYTYILYMLHERERAEDVFQETFVKAIIKLQEGKYSDNGKFLAWLMRIAHNIIMDHFRSQKASHTIEPTEDNDLSNLSGKELLDGNIENQFVNSQVLTDVKRMMSHLPDAQREVVYMRFYQQMSFKEIAESTNVSINTALGRMRYALTNLRRMAKQYHLELQLD